MKIGDIAAAIEKYAPRENAYEWDNVGMMLGDTEAECTGVLVCLDCTFATALQARDEGCNLIVSHHPFIFRPLERLTLDDPKAKMVRFLFRNNIAVYSAHTNLDIAHDGLARTLAEIFGGHDIVGEGSGCYATVAEESAAQLAHKVSGALGDPSVKVSSPEAKVKRVYVVSGAGGDRESLACAMRGADALVTGEVKHHVFVEADERDFPIVEFSHYYSEILCCDVLKGVIKSSFDDVNVITAHRRCPYKTLEEV